MPDLEFIKEIEMMGVVIYLVHFEKSKLKVFYYTNQLPLHFNKNDKSTYPLPSKLDNRLYCLP